MDGTAAVSRHEIVRLMAKYLADEIFPLDEMIDGGGRVGVDVLVPRSVLLVMVQVYAQVVCRWRVVLIAFGVVLMLLCCIGFEIRQDLLSGFRQLVFQLFDLCGLLLHFSQQLFGWRMFAARLTNLARQFLALLLSRFELRA